MSKAQVSSTEEGQILPQYRGEFDRTSRDVLHLPALMAHGDFGSIEPAVNTLPGWIYERGFEVLFMCGSIPRENLWKAKISPAQLYHVLDFCGTPTSERGEKKSWELEMILDNAPLSLIQKRLQAVAKYAEDYDLPHRVSLRKWANGHYWPQNIFLYLP